jgi:O-antigen/teichoic acid export membrane protein
MMTLSNLLDSVFQAERAAQYVLLRGTTFGALKLLTLVILIVAVSRSGEWVLVSWVSAISVTTAYSIARQLKNLGRAHRYGLLGVGAYLRSRTSMLLLHHVTTFSGFLVPSVMPILVVARLSSTANAKFYIAWLLSSILLTISGAVSGNLLSDASYNVTELRVKTRFAVRMIAVLMVPAMVILVLLGHPLLEIFGKTYARSAYGILIIFVVVAIPDAITNVYVTILRVQHRRGTAAVMNFCMAVITLGGAWALMPRLGPSGAAWAWAAGQAAGTAFVFVDAIRTNTHKGAHRKGKHVKSRQSSSRRDREARLDPATARYAPMAC